MKKITSVTFDHLPSFCDVTVETVFYGDVTYEYIRDERTGRPRLLGAYAGHGMSRHRTPHRDGAQLAAGEAWRAMRQAHARVEAWRERAGLGRGASRGG